MVRRASKAWPVGSVLASFRASTVAPALSMCIFWSPLAATRDATSRNPKQDEIGPVDGEPQKAHRAKNGHNDSCVHHVFSSCLAFFKMREMPQRRRMRCY
ncbi:hypothetical protein [Pandoravirus japonicus]|uniref:Uncharacterized protein n=1 Tax=Pandoravirus japonicus TaxID=2823154 RepID=A0A811BNY9_9VIRU|nr:hypothetical protein [Pandoravirus japonicus]